MKELTEEERAALIAQIKEGAGDWAVTSVKINGKDVEPEDS